MNQDERRLGHNSWETGQEEVCDVIIEMVQMLPPPQAFLIHSKLIPMWAPEIREVNSRTM